MNDATVIEKILSGETSYFEVLVLKYQNKLYATILNITKNSHTAEDIVQEAFLKSFQKLYTLRDRKQFYPWLKRIAINLALLTFEKNKRMVDVSSEDDSYDFFDNITSKESPESEILNEELKKYVRKYVDSLPDKLRVVIILREVEDLSYEEISEILKIPVGTVRSRLFNARQFIKQRLINQGLADGLYKIS